MMMEEGEKNAIDRLLEIPGDVLITDDDRGHIAEQLSAKRWDDLKVLSIGTRLLFPDKVYRREKGGRFVGDPCTLVVPRGPELRKAKLEAYRIAAEDGIDPVRDKALFDDLEDVCVLWYSIRSPADAGKDGEAEQLPEPLCMSPRELETRYDRPSLSAITGKLAMLKRVVDPQVSGLPEDELVGLTAALVQLQDLRSLFAYDGATQTAFILSAAKLVQAYLTARSSLGSSAPSTAA